MSDFADFHLYEDKCPQCGTAAIYELSPNSFACKCTYEAEINQHDHAENDTNVINFDNKSTESARTR